MKRLIHYYLPLLTVLGFILWGCQETPYPTSTVSGDEVSSKPGEVLNKRAPGLPHNGECVSYCARAIVHVFVGEGTEVPVDDPTFSLDDWVPFDFNGDGKIQNCLAEKGFDGKEHCIKVGPTPGLGCPEWDVDGDGIGDRCVQPGDGWGFWCRLMHGQDHGH